jgi:protein-L-isoaspartate(D-aspartate) O-methyltransferase
LFGEVVVLRFAEACTIDGAVPSSPAASSAWFQGPPMYDFATARQKMVDGQVRTSDVTDRRVVDAMLAVPREAFIPPSRQPLAYLDIDLDVTEGGSAKRFLLKPAVTAKMLQAAAIGPADTALVVGCATGYMAALVGALAGRVIATENDPALASKAKDVLGRVGCVNVTVKEGAASEGVPSDAPFDVIVLNGATEIPPEALYGQLGEGGRLVGVFAIEQPARATMVTRSRGDIGHRDLFDAAAPVLPGLERRPVFIF